MTDGLVIMWAASRTTTPAEERLLSDLARTVPARIQTTAIALLARELIAAMIQGPVVVVVSSRKDAANALALGADEIVRVAKSVTLRKSTMEAAIERARARSRGRTAVTPSSARPQKWPGLALLMRVLERRLGCPADAAAARCNELAEELTRVVAIADRLMQRVQVGAERDELKGWFNEVKDYARFTLKAGALASALQEEVQRTSAVVKLLGDISTGRMSATDLSSLLNQLADYLRDDLAPDIGLEVVTPGRCLVDAPRPTLIWIVCAAVEISLDNVVAKGHPGRLVLRASKTDAAVVLEVVDDGIPGSTYLHASILDPLFASTRTARLRQIRERVLDVSGDLVVDEDDGSNGVSIYLPGLDTIPGVVREKPRPQLERSNQ